MIIDKTLEANSSVILYKCTYIGTNKDVIEEEIFFSQYVIHEKDIVKLEQWLLWDCQAANNSLEEVIIEPYYRFPRGYYIGSVWKDCGLND